MCGITGIIALNEKGKVLLGNISAATNCLSQRGPDKQAVFTDQRLALGHSRLAVVDTSSSANQPFTDSSGRYTIVFNGEFFNHKVYRQQLKSEGISFRSHSDTEVLLYLYIRDKEACLKYINGFFSLAIYDKQEGTIFWARDRFGVKPLLLYKDENIIAFGSELKALLALGMEKKLNKAALILYLQLNYLPPGMSMLQGVEKLAPGHFRYFRNEKLEDPQAWYQLPSASLSNAPANYKEAAAALFQLMENAVQLRLEADVPVGAFLSGGIDSSVITALAAMHKPDLHTFSIGFAEEPLFDETKYASLVAKKHNTQHTVFSLRNEDLYDQLHKVLDYIDEPFADSSALAVNILSMHTRKHVTVALSGDGADELFAGYNKHAAALKAMHPGILEKIISAGQPIWQRLPQSRNSFIGNKIRQLNRFSQGMSLPHPQRYWQWASLMSESDAIQLLKPEFVDETIQQELHDYERLLLKGIPNDDSVSLNHYLKKDVELVLAGDMLVKVDLMSMANSLEVRTPFLDYRVVEFAFSLPVDWKINAGMRKRILKDAFRDYLPEELYHRGKQGFEVPLLKWFKGELKSTIEQEWLEEDFIREQAIFDPNSIKLLKQKLFSNSPGDAVAQTWALIVFQHWWKKYFAPETT